MISIVTGTLNRKHILKYVIENTILSNSNLELVLVDGGSTDGTIEYINSLNNKSIKLIEVGKRSSYPHFMNEGIKNASYDFICQWNDDVLLINNWEDILEEIKNPYDAWIFSWKELTLEEIFNKQQHNSIAWNIYNSIDKTSGEIVMNYGIYKKELFKKFGMYDTKFDFYFADGELSHRFYKKEAKIKNCYNIRVGSIKGISKHSSASNEQFHYYNECLENQRKNKFQPHLEML